MREKRMTDIIVSTCPDCGLSDNASIEEVDEVTQEVLAAIAKPAPKGGDFIESWSAPIAFVCDGFVFSSDKDVRGIQISDLEPVPGQKNTWRLKAEKMRNP